MAPSTGDPSTAVAVSHPVTVKIGHEENKLEPGNHPPATVLPNNVPASAITSQPKIRRVDVGVDVGVDVSDDAYSVSGVSEEWSSLDQGKCAPSKCCKKRTCGGWACCIIIGFFKILGIILQAVGESGKRRRRRRRWGGGVDIDGDYDAGDCD